MRLSIAEGYYLIALDDEEGRVLAAAEKRVVPGIVAGAILELYIQKKITIGGGMVKVEDTVGTGNGILDNVLKRLTEGSSVLDNVKSVASKYKELLEDINGLLAQRGILKKEETKLLWIPLSERMDNANYAFEQEIRNNLKAIVFKNAKPSPSFTILFVLVDASGILSEVFQDRDDFIDAENVGKGIVEKSGVSTNLASAINDVKKYLLELE